MSEGSLNVVDTVSGGDIVVINQNSSTRYRGATVATLQSYMQSNLTFSGNKTKVVAQTTASGQTVNAFPTGTTTTSSDIWLIISPLASYAAMTILLPALGGLKDGQEIMINCTQSVTVTLTISTNGAAGVIGAPTTLAANAFFTLKYDAITTNWYRVD